MPSITPKINRDGSFSFQVAVRLAGEKPYYRTFEGKEEATRFASGLEDELRTKRQAEFEASREPALSRLTREKVATIVADFVCAKDETMTYTGIVPTLTKHVQGLRVGDFNRPWMKSYVERMRGQMTRRNTAFSYASIHKHIALIRSAIKWRADELNLIEIPSLPSLEGVFPEKCFVERERRLERDELAALYRRLRRIKPAQRAHWVALVRLALETGARLQELVLAEWGEFDIKRRYWQLPAGHTKCRKSRSIPLSRKAIAILKRLRDYRSVEKPRVFHLLGNPNAVSTGFFALRKAAGLHNFRFHDLRHEAICRMVLYKRQLRIYEIMRIVGHSSVAMINRYANLRGEELAERMD